MFNYSHHRQNTFSNYNLNVETINQLVAAGFYFDKIENKVMCFNCKVTLPSWQDCKRPDIKHVEYMIKEQKICQFTVDRHYSDIFLSEKLNRRGLGYKLICGALTWSNCCKTVFDASLDIDTLTSFMKAILMEKQVNEMSFFNKLADQLIHKINEIPTEDIKPEYIRPQEELYNQNADGIVCEQGLVSRIMKKTTTNIESSPRSIYSRLSIHKCAYIDIDACD